MPAPCRELTKMHSGAVNESRARGGPPAHARSRTVSVLPRPAAIARRRHTLTSVRPAAAGRSRPVRDWYGTWPYADLFDDRYGSDAVGTTGRLLPRPGRRVSGNLVPGRARPGSA